MIHDETNRKKRDQSDQAEAWSDQRSQDIERQFVLQAPSQIIKRIAVCRQQRERIYDKSDARVRWPTQISLEQIRHRDRGDDPKRIEPERAADKELKRPEARLGHDQANHETANREKEVDSDPAVVL